MTVNNCDKTETPTVTTRPRPSHTITVSLNRGQPFQGGASCYSLYNMGSLINKLTN